MKSKAIRDAARGEVCTCQIPGICNFDKETTCLAHLRTFGGAGTGIKPTDLAGVFACSRCHDYIDGRLQPLGMEPVQLDWILGRALIRTHVRLVERGVLIVKGQK